MFLEDLKLKPHCDFDLVDSNWKLSHNTLARDNAHLPILVAKGYKNPDIWKQELIEDLTLHCDRDYLKIIRNSKLKGEHDKLSHDDAPSYRVWLHVKYTSVVQKLSSGQRCDTQTHRPTNGQMDNLIPVYPPLRWTWQTESWWCTIIPSLVACEVYFSGSEAIFWTEMWHTDTQTDKRTDGQPDSSIPPTNYITLRGGTIKNTIHTWKVVDVVSNIAL